MGEKREKKKRKVHDIVFFEHKRRSSQSNQACMLLVYWSRSLVIWSSGNPIDRRQRCVKQKRRKRGKTAFLSETNVHKVCIKVSR